MERNGANLSWLSLARLFCFSARNRAWREWKFRIKGGTGAIDLGAVAIRWLSQERSVICGTLIYEEVLSVVTAANCCAHINRVRNRLRSGYRQSETAGTILLDSRCISRTGDDRLGVHRY